MLQTDIGPRAKVTPAAALAAYDSAMTGGGPTFEEAAHMLAAALRKPPRKAGGDLAAPIKVGRRAKYWGDFVIAWADGTETLVRGVIYDRPADRWAAAFQAADRLRRMRLRHAWEHEPDAPPRWTRGPLGLQIQSQPYEAFVRERPMPAPVQILAEDGEVFAC
jgi:hypothetical protein